MLIVANRCSIRGNQSYELWDRILEGKVDSEIQGQVIGAQTKMQIFNFFFRIQLRVFGYLSSTLQ